MLGLLEDRRTEFKVKLTEDIEKEVIAFLNTEGENIFIGIDASDFSKILAVDVVDVKSYFDASGKGIIEITHSDGTIDRYDASEFIAQENDIMTR